MIVATSTPKGFKVGAELIKVYQNTDFSHVLLIKDDLVFQASHGYVNCTYIDIFLENNEIISVYEIDDSKIDFDFVKKQLGKKYSFKQIFLIPFLRFFKIKYNSDGDNRFICSEYIGKALRLDWVTDLTTPKEIDNYLRSI